MIRPDRAQLSWDMVDLDSQLSDDHRARVVWAFVEGLDLGEFYDRISTQTARTFPRPCTRKRDMPRFFIMPCVRSVSLPRR